MKQNVLIVEHVSRCARLILKLLTGMVETSLEYPPMTMTAVYAATVVRRHAPREPSLLRRRYWVESTLAFDK